MNPGLRWAGHDLVFHLLKPSITLNGGVHWLYRAVCQPEREGSEVSVVLHLVRAATSRVVDGVRDHPRPLLPSSIWNIKRGIYPTHPPSATSQHDTEWCVCVAGGGGAMLYLSRHGIWGRQMDPSPVSIILANSHKDKLMIFPKPYLHVLLTFSLETSMSWPCNPTLYQIGQAYGEGEWERDRAKDMNQRAVRRNKP